MHKQCMQLYLGRKNHSLAAICSIYIIVCKLRSVWWKRSCFSLAATGIYQSHHIRPHMISSHHHTAINWLSQAQTRRSPFPSRPGPPPHPHPTSQTSLKPHSAWNKDNTKLQTPSASNLATTPPPPPRISQLLPHPSQKPSPGNGQRSAALTMTSDGVSHLSLLCLWLFHFLSTNSWTMR